MREVVLSLVQRYLPNSLRPTGATGNFLTKCPFHKGGQETTPSFSVNVDKGVFQCFTCKESGDIRRLLRLLGLSREKIDSEVKIIQPQLEANREMLKFESENFFSNRDPFKADAVLPEAQLGVYEWLPTQLAEAGFDPRLLQDMEVGYDRRNNRITYPIRDFYGSLAGFAGGATMGQYPKYKVYQGGYRDVRGIWVPGDFGPEFDQEHPGYKCENHDFLWNYNRVYPRVAFAMSEAESTIFVVEGYKACLWMIQCGYVNTVALMGSSISQRQQRMLHRLGGPVVLCLDNDNAGRKGTNRIGELLYRPLYGRVLVMPYPEQDLSEDTQPDDYTQEGIFDMVSHAVDFHSWQQDMFSRFPWLKKRGPDGRSEFIPS